MNQYVIIMRSILLFLGNVSSLMLFAYPAGPKILRILRERVTNENSIPIFISLISTITWAWYAFVISNTFGIVVNVLGCVLQLLYITIILKYGGPNRLRIPVHNILILKIVVCIIVVGLFLVTIFKRLMLTLGLIQFFIPFSVVCYGVISLNEDFISIPQSVLWIIINGTSMGLYGIWTDDEFITVTYGWGMLLGQASIGSYFIIRAILE